MFIHDNVGQKINFGVCQKTQQGAVMDSRQVSSTIQIIHVI